MALTKITGEGVGAVDNLTVDTNTLVVDAANNSVGIGTTSLITASGRSSLTLSTANEKGELHLQNRTATTSSDTGVLTFNNGSNRIGAIQSTADGATDKGKLIFMSLSGGSVAGRMDLTEHGLTFNGDTAAANALDDYEEGNFTVTISSGISVSSYDHQLGHYVKVGRQVTAWVFMEYNGSSRTGSHFIISGLPFNSSDDNTTESTFGGFIGYQNGFSNTNNIVHVPRGTNIIQFYEVDGSTLIGSELSGASGEIRVVVQYTVP